MKAHELIADLLSEWHAVHDAADLAHQIFDGLDDEELSRLAMRGLTEEVRRALVRSNPNGVPTYSSVERVNVTTGKTERFYKQTELFEVADYEVAVRSYRKRADQNAAIAAALIRDCKVRLGVQLNLDEATA